MERDIGAQSVKLRRQKTPLGVSDQQTALSRYLSGMLSELNEKDWMQAYWLIGEKHRGAVKTACDIQGYLIFSESANLMFGLPVRWTDGNKIQLRVAGR